MFEDRYLLEVAVMIADGVEAGGEPVFRAYPGRALLLESTQLDARRDAALADGRTFLLRCAQKPEPGGRIVLDGESFELRKVTVCRDLDGRIECYRCAVI